jgi:hypothetical protein
MNAFFDESAPVAQQPSQPPQQTQEQRGTKRPRPSTPTTSPPVVQPVDYVSEDESSEDDDLTYPPSPPPSYASSDASGVEARPARAPAPPAHPALWEDSDHHLEAFRGEGGEDIGRMKRAKSDNEPMSLGFVCSLSSIAVNPNRV